MTKIIIKSCPKSSSTFAKQSVSIIPRAFCPIIPKQTQNYSLHKFQNPKIYSTKALISCPFSNHNTNPKLFASQIPNTQSIISGNHPIHFEKSAQIKLPAVRDLNTEFARIACTFESEMHKGALIPARLVRPFNLCLLLLARLPQTLSALCPFVDFHTAMWSAGWREKVSGCAFPLLPSL
jgi:hypothetical protein